MASQKTKNGKSTAGPPTKEQRRINRLRDNVKSSLDKQLDAFERLNEEYPNVISSLLALAKGQNNITLPDGTQQLIGDYQTIKFLINYHQDLYAKLDEALHYLDGGEDIKVSQPSGVVAKFSPRAV